MTTKWEKHLKYLEKESAAKFLLEIRAQIPLQLTGLFDATLNALLEPTEEVQDRLDKLNALERQGVDNWDGYDDAMDSLNTDEDEDDED